MSDEPTERDVVAVADLIYVRQSRRSIAHHILASDWFADRIAQARREGAAEALDEAAADLRLDEHAWAGDYGTCQWLETRAKALREER